MSEFTWKQPCPFMENFIKWLYISPKEKPMHLAECVDAADVSVLFLGERYVISAPDDSDFVHVYDLEGNRVFADNMFGGKVFVDRFRILQAGG